MQLFDLGSSFNVFFSLHISLRDVRTIAQSFFSYNKVFYCNEYFYDFNDTE